MKARRFKTDIRLWFWIALVLFVSSWFLPITGVKIPMRPIAVVPLLWSSIFGPDASLRGALEVGLVLGFSLCLAGIVSLFFGWLLQCLIVMLRSSKRDHEDRAA
jgi:hypothetical protein